MEKRGALLSLLRVYAHETRERASSFPPSSYFIPRADLFIYAGLDPASASADYTPEREILDKDNGYTSVPLLSALSIKRVFSPSLVLPSSYLPPARIIDYTY